MMASSRDMSFSSSPIGRQSWCMLHAEQLAFNAGTFRGGGWLLGLLTGMDWIMVLCAVAWMRSGVADMPDQ
jgi:hypothetical protein